MRPLRNSCGCRKFGYQPLCRIQRPMNQFRRGTRQMSTASGSAITARIASLASGVHRSSESSEKIQSPRQAAMALLRSGPKPSKSICTTRAPRRSAISMVPSVEWESARTISSAQRTLEIAASILSASL